jgi:hypothetical protein
LKRSRGVTRVWRTEPTYYVDDDDDVNAAPFP